MHKGEVTVALARVLELVCRVNAGGRGGCSSVRSKQQHSLGVQGALQSQSWTGLPRTTGGKRIPPHTLGGY